MSNVTEAKHSIMGNVSSPTHAYRTGETNAYQERAMILEAAKKPNVSIGDCLMDLVNGEDDGKQFKLTNIGMGEK